MCHIDLFSKTRVNPGPEVIKLFSCSTQLSMKFQLHIKSLFILKCWKDQIFLVLKLSDAVFILLINVKMPTIVGILTFMSRMNFMLQLSWEWKQFYTLGTVLQVTGWAPVVCWSHIKSVLLWRHRQWIVSWQRVHFILPFLRYIWAMTCDFQQCGSLTSVD